MIYVSELYGSFYVEATTRAPMMEKEAVRFFADGAFDTREDAGDAAKQIRDWVKLGLWNIRATDRATGQPMHCLTWSGLPSDGIEKAKAEAAIHDRDCYGYFVTPVLTSPRKKTT